VTRPGRCAVKIEYKSLQDEEIRKWLKDRNLETDEKPETLAELFAIEQNYKVNDKKKAGKPIGFALTS